MEGGCRPPPQRKQNRLLGRMLIARSKSFVLFFWGLCFCKKGGLCSRTVCENVPPPASDSKTNELFVRMYPLLLIFKRNGLLGNGVNMS